MRPLFLSVKIPMGRFVVRSSVSHPSGPVNVMRESESAHAGLTGRLNTKCPWPDSASTDGAKRSEKRRAPSGPRPSIL